MSITPKQAFEAIKILHPETHRITAYTKRTQWLHQWFSTGSFSLFSISVDIDWGDTDQYPLPEPEWVDAVMPYDWGKDARFGDDKTQWAEGMISGYSTLPDRSFRWWSGFSVYKFCQVRKVKT